MQLKYDISIRNKIITLGLETANFSKEEKRALEKLGEPNIKLEKIYNGIHSVSIDKKLKTSFKLRLRFDGSDDIEKAMESLNEFLDDIKETIEDKMSILMDKHYMLADDLNKSNGYIDIKYD